MPSHLRVALMLIVLGCLAFGDSHFSAITEGNRLYRQGKYRAALDMYNRANRGKDSDVSRYNRGNAHYKLREYDEAARSFATALSSPDSGLGDKAALNFASAKTASGIEKMSVGKDPSSREDLESAIAAFHKILLKDPGNLSAKHNMEIAMRKMDEIKTPEKPPPQNNSQRQEKDSENPRDRENRSKEAKQRGDQEHAQKRDVASPENADDRARKELASKILNNIQIEEDRVQKQLRRFTMPDTDVERDW